MRLRSKEKPMSHEWLGAIAATLTTLSFLPQAAKTLRTRETHAISLWMYVAFTIGLVFWFVYGVMLDSWPIIIANAVTLVLASTILVLKLRHG